MSSSAVHGLVAKTRAEKRKGRRSKTQHATSPRPAHKAKINMIIESLALFDPNAVRKTATVVAGPVRPAAARHAPIRHRVLSARLRPVLRRAAGRCRFAESGLMARPAALRPWANVGCNCRLGKGRNAHFFTTHCMRKRQNPRIVRGENMLQNKTKLIILMM